MHTEETSVEAVRGAPHPILRSFDGGPEKRVGKLGNTRNLSRHGPIATFSLAFAKHDPPQAFVIMVHEREKISKVADLELTDRQRLLLGLKYLSLKNHCQETGLGRLKSFVTDSLTDEETRALDSIITLRRRRVVHAPVD